MYTTVGFTCFCLVVAVRLWRVFVSSFFFFNDTATTEIYTLSLHDALPIARSGIRRSNCSGNGSLASPAATPTATTPPGWPTMRSTSSCSSAILSPGRPWPRSPRCRFENAVGPRELIAMGHVLADTVIEHHRRRLKGRATRITIDLDPTDDPTHGQQEFTFFNGHYDMWCYLPVVATVTFNAEAEQYAVAAVLRPGNAPASLGACGLLRRLIRRLRAAFHSPTIRVRLDGGFATPKVFTFLEAEQVEHVVGMSSNTRLEKRARRLMGKARMRSKATGRTEHLYGETRYAAKTWKRRRRGIIKAEVVRHPGRDPKNNPRFVVTNLPHAPRTVYEEIYCRRGDGENRLKGLHHALEKGRTSGSRYLANQFRVLLSLAAYLLFQELQRRARGTACADAQVTTLRERLLKLAVWVERSVRRIVLHLPATFPWRSTWQRLACAVGATP